MTHDELVAFLLHASERTKVEPWRVTGTLQTTGSHQDGTPFVTEVPLDVSFTEADRLLTTSWRSKPELLFLRIIDPLWLTRGYELTQLETGTETESGAIKIEARRAGEVLFSPHPDEDRYIVGVDSTRGLVLSIESISEQGTRVRVQQILGPTIEPALFRH